MFWSVLGDQGTLGRSGRGYYGYGEGSCFEHGWVIRGGVSLLFDVVADRFIGVPHGCFVFVEVESDLCEVVFYAVHGLSEVFRMYHDVHVVHIGKDFGFPVDFAYCDVGGVDGLVESVNKAQGGEGASHWDSPFGSEDTVVSFAHGACVCWLGEEPRNQPWVRHRMKCLSCVGNCGRFYLAERSSNIQADKYHVGVDLEVCLNELVYLLGSSFASDGILVWFEVFC